MSALVPVQLIKRPLYGFLVIHIRLVQLRVASFKSRDRVLRIQELATQRFGAPRLEEG